MIEEAAPLVEVDDEHGVGPCRALRDCEIDLVQKGLAIANVGVRMIVVGCAAVFIYEARIDEGDVGQCSCGAGKEELCIGPANREIARAP